MTIDTYDQESDEAARAWSRLAMDFYSAGEEISHASTVAAAIVAEWEPGQVAAYVAATNSDVTS